MTEQKKALKIEFAPGCFDNFDGTQEELDELMLEIQRMFESGELEENAIEVDMDALMEEDPEEAAALMEALARNDDAPRTLH
jgi:hypothetical protein